jgi:integrase
VRPGKDLITGQYRENRVWPMFYFHHSDSAPLPAVATNPPWLRPLLVASLHTGMRRGELLTLTWKDVDFSRGLLRVERSKNGEKRAWRFWTGATILLQSRPEGFDT